jgi:hypothetical protein
MSQLGHSRLNQPALPTVYVRYTPFATEIAWRRNMSRRANCGRQRAAQQQEIIALHLQRQSRTAPKMLDRRSAGWRHCNPLTPA